MTLRLSNSEMALFRECKRRWWLSQYRRLGRKDPPGPGSPLSIGNMVHDSLAAYYGEGADPVTFAIAKQEERKAADLENLGLYDKEIKLVTAMLSGYLEWLEETGSDSDLRVVGAESMVEVPLPGMPDVTLLSKLDAPVEQISTGQRLALEHKTVGDLSTPLQLLRIDTQLLTEHLARYLHALQEGKSREEAQNECSGVLYNMIRKVQRTAAAKPPFFRREIVPHNVHELRNHWLHVQAIANEILLLRTRLDAGESHHTAAPPSPSKDCKWKCEFFRCCPMFDDGSDVEGYLSAYYKERDPLERYSDSESL